MDLLQTLALILFFASLYILGVRKSAKRLPLPPGPKPLPIIGNILDLGEKPHHSLTKLSKIYGPLMRLQLGSLTSIIVSSPEMVKMVLQKHDQAFAGRSIPEVAKSLDHHKFSVAWTAPPENQWRKLRKACKEKIFSTQKMDASQGLRRDKVQKLLDHVNECAINSQAVDIGKASFTTSLNVMSASLFSVDFATFESDSSDEFRDIATGLRSIGGKPNVSDFFPTLRKIDPQGIVKKTTVYLKKFFKVFDEILHQKMKNRGANGEFLKSKNDVLEELLDGSLRNESDQLSVDDIKHLFLDLFLGGTDTISITVEWTMTQLLRNPEKMLKAKDELKNVLGQKKEVEDSDISRLPYLRAVMKETFRLHPVVPLLFPHKAVEDMEVNGYLIPKNAQVLINAWAIGRDSSIWSNADQFIPERFLDQETDFRGRHFELIPFGGGRRICAGLPLADRLVHVMVAALIHNFDWKLEQGSDLDDKFGISLKKANALKAIPIKV